MNDDIQKALAEEFDASELEWKISRWGTKKRKSDAGETFAQQWAVVVPYIDSRSIMQRLDDIIGCQHWQVRYDEHPQSIDCTIGIRAEILLPGELGWIEKQDGCGKVHAPDDPVNAAKGDRTTALRRAAVAWGIGRYLYFWPDPMWARISDTGANWQKTGDNTGFNWDPPQLPAPPKNERQPTPPTSNGKTTGSKAYLSFERSLEEAVEDGIWPDLNAAKTFVWPHLEAQGFRGPEELKATRSKNRLAAALAGALAEIDDATTN